MHGSRALQRLWRNSGALYAKALLFRLDQDGLVHCFALQSNKRIRRLDDTQGSCVELDTR
jgi:hypothetical protein